MFQYNSVKCNEILNEAENPIILQPGGSSDTTNSPALSLLLKWVKIDFTNFYAQTVFLH